MSGNEETGSENAIGWFILAGVFAALAFLVWYIAEYEIKNIIRWIRYGEIWLIDKVLQAYGTVYQFVMGTEPPPFQFGTESLIIFTIITISSLKSPQPISITR